MSALINACEKAVEQAGVAVVDLLLVGLADDTAEEGAAELVFDTCRFAVHGLATCDQKIRVLKASYEKAYRVADDTTVADALNEGRTIAAQQQGAQAVETLLDYYRASALEMAGDSWALLEVLAENLAVITPPMANDETAFALIKRSLRDGMAEDGVEGLWDYYNDRLGWLGETEHVETLLKAYERTIYAVTDLKWLADRIFEVCDDIAYAGDDHSFWLPDRQQLSRACMNVIEAVSGRAVAHSAISRAFEVAIGDTSTPWDVLSKAFRDVMTRADDEAKRRIAAATIRAAQKATREVFSKIASSTQSVVEDRERLIELLLKAGETERAFWAFQRVQESPKEDRQRAVEWLLEELSERENNRGRVSSGDDPPEMSLFRAFGLAATALSDPSTTVNLVATIHMATHGAEHDIDIEHALSHFQQVIAALDDTANEAGVMYGAYIAAIADGNDPSLAVETLLEATKEAIARTDDPIGALKMLLSGLAVQPSGWPPPTPAWLVPYAT